MADGRRHSLDIPISRTLTALRRVRSLRDPSTTSMSKFSGLADNVNWNTNSNNEISILFSNDSGEDEAGNYGLSKSTNLCLPREEKNCDDNLTDSKWILCNGDESMKENYFFSSKVLKDVDSSNELIVNPYRTRKSRCRNQVQPSCSVGDTGSQVSSQSQSTVSGVSKLNSSPFLNDEVDAIKRNHSGCVMGCCWSKMQKFRESNLSSEAEGYPLSSRNVDETALNGRIQRDLKHVSKGRLPHQVTPRNFSQKFRPTTFDDLVGQKAVSKSLLGAVLLAKISSFYIFFGPRGTGKTSASRIFAAALNCLSFEEQRPCGLCQECVSFFSERSRDIQEVDSLRINKPDRIRSLLKNAISPSSSSRFKVFIIDECHMMSENSWATLMSSFDKFSRHSVFLMITPDLDRLPRSIISQSQRFYFPKIRDADIASRLGKICLEERLDFDQDTLDFISSKSNGSLRDAEMMLEQLSLLGEKITLSLAHELIGFVSDEELLDLLDLALSSDTSNTVIRARELMRSRIDPMQLISQLADLIMDILAGKHESSSEIRRKFIANHTNEADVQKLSHALKILSEAEKRLRISKNQTTWLTFALLQLSSMESFLTNSHEKKFCLRNANDKEGDYCSRSSGGENLNHLVSSCVGVSDECKGTLESIWKRAAELPQSNSIRKLLRKRGKLSALSINQGLAIAELEFSHPNHVAQAEKSWKLIASSLQAILGCNVEIIINLPQRDLGLKYPKRRWMKALLMTECCSNFGLHDYYNSEKEPCTGETPLLTCSSCCGSLDCNHKVEVVSRNLRNGDGNVLSTRATRMC